MFSGLPTHGIRGTDILIIEWLTLALALIAVGLRLHSRRISLNVLGWDDYTVLAVTVGLLENKSKNLLTSTPGVCPCPGRHRRDPS